MSAFTDGWTEKMIIDAFDGGRFNALGFFDGDALVGVITFSYSVDTADIEDIAVDKEFRRKGLGDKLLCEALKKIQDENKEKVFLEVRGSNIPAINLYKKAGFTNLSVRKKYYDDGEDAVVMAKELRV